MPTDVQNVEPPSSLSFHYSKPGRLQQTYVYLCPVNLVYGLVGLVDCASHMPRNDPRSLHSYKYKDFLRGLDLLHAVGLYKNRKISRMLVVENLRRLSQSSGTNS